MSAANEVSFFTGAGTIVVSLEATEESIAKIVVSVFCANNETGNVM